MLVGVLVTVLVQSSSTSTSIFITMVAADLLTVKQAISLIMGANIGTSVTSTIVALGQSGNRNEFRRAFAAATVHDMFNFLNVLVLLPLEVITGYLYALSKAIVDSTPGLQPGEKPPDILKKLTKPFTSKIIGIDKKLITKIAEGKVDADDDSVGMIKHIFGDTSYKEDGKDDVLIGWIVLIISLTILCICLYTIVYLLKSILKGHIALWLHKGVNGQVPDIKCGETVTIPMGWAAGYLAMAVGLGLTICVQSSSITTSALTPLVGIGVITIERMYPVVLGANIGTCITGVLTASADKLALTLQAGGLLAPLLQPDGHLHLVRHLAAAPVPHPGRQVLGQHYRRVPLVRHCLPLCVLLDRARHLHGDCLRRPGGRHPRRRPLCARGALRRHRQHDAVPLPRAPPREAARLALAARAATLAAAIRHVHLRAVGRAARQVLQVLRQGRRRAAQGPQGPGQGASGQHGRARQGR